MLRTVAEVCFYAVGALLPLAGVLPFIDWTVREDVRRWVWRVYLAALGMSETGLLTIFMLQMPIGRAVEAFLFLQLLAPAVVVLGFTDS